MDIYPVFVYGTLKRGFRNFSRYLHTEQFVQAAYVLGDLYTLEDADYPALINTDTSKNLCFGELFACDIKTCNALDELEEYDEQNPYASMYYRIQLPVYTMQNKRYTQAWTYVYNTENPLFSQRLCARIPDGIYKK